MTSGASVSEPRGQVDVSAALRSVQPRGLHLRCSELLQRRRRQVMRGGILLRPLAQRSARSGRPSASRIAAARASGVGVGDQPVAPSRTSSAGPPLSVQVSTALPRRERLDGHEAVVLVEWREHDGATARRVIDQRRVVDAADERHAIVEVEPPAQPEERARARAFAGDDAADPGGLRLGERTQDEIEPLQRREPRHGEQVVAVAVAAVGPQREAADRAPPTRFRPQRAAAPGPCPRSRTAADVARQQVSVHAWISARRARSLSRLVHGSRPTETIPQIVVPRASGG